MKVLLQVIGKVVEFGGDVPSGWLPSNAATPLAERIEKVILDVRILEDGEGFILEWQSANTHYSNDSWHASIEDAKSRAMDQFGIETSEWQETD